MTRIQPQLYRGVFDLSPEKSAVRRRMIDTVRAVYERYGYQPLDTPSLERLDVLTGEVGEETTKEIFAFKDPDDQAIGLRFDLTVSLARYFAANQQHIPQPFRRYQVGACWRLDKPDMAFGRFREFVQFDIDSVGAATVLADAELIGAQVEALAAIGVPDFVVRISNRKALAALVHCAGLPPAREADVLRVIDKLDKVGREAVRQELGAGRVDVSGDPIRGLELADSAIAKIDAFLDLARESTRASALAAARELLGSAPGASEGLDELAEMDRAFAIMGLPEERVRFDLSVARGLAYYTGPVFETILTSLPRFGAICAGGRYDRLVERFGGQRVPGTGVSIGIDRLLAALETLGKLPVVPSSTEVLVTIMAPEIRLECMLVADMLRRAGLATELYVGGKKQLGKQLQYADRRRIPVAVILGEDELKAGEITVKEMGEAAAADASDLQSHDEWKGKRFGQQRVARDALVASVREALAIYRARAAGSV